MTIMQCDLLLPLRRRVNQRQDKVERYRRKRAEAGRAGISVADLQRAEKDVPDDKPEISAPRLKSKNRPRKVTRRKAHNVDQHDLVCLLLVSVIKSSASDMSTLSQECYVSIPLRSL